MKFKATKKELINNYATILCIGYCDIQYLLNYQNPQSYCCGVYGWNCDNYDINGVLISTGYRPIDGKRPDYKVTRKYNLKARDIVEDWHKDHNKQVEEVNALLSEFISEVLSND